MMSFPKFLKTFFFVALLLALSGIFWFIGIRHSRMQAIQFQLSQNSLSQPGLETLAQQPQFVARRAQKKNLPPMIWVHGGPGRSESWILPQTLQALEQSFTMIYWDQPGAGKSAASSQGLSLDLLQQSLQELIHKEKKQVWLAGHDLGFALSLLFASKHPQKVAGLIGISPVFGLQTALWRTRERLLISAREQLNSRAYAQLEELKLPLSPHEGARIETWNSRLGGEVHNREAWRDALYQSLWHPWFSLREAFLLGSEMEASLLQLWGDFQNVDLRLKTGPAIPTLVLIGEHDLKSDPRDTRDWLQSLKTSCKKMVTIQDAAHFPQIENPKAVYQAILQFHQDCKSENKPSP